MSEDSGWNTTFTPSVEAIIVQVLGVEHAAANGTLTNVTAHRSARRPMDCTTLPGDD